MSFGIYYVSVSNTLIKAARRVAGFLCSPVF
nr:MAG TPA: hypothetical protein [Caudoviricetes sp.]